ncbi:phosphatidylglycerophosphatase [Halobiforma lacisalsi AJ5]|uniref:Phosphatidylglycerophosphatase n=1 Tax=Natronobacterium lacisalsi AJ5 TaxID=358396 RepID=M0LEP5_NATLA|nr:phosphatase PAP2 family protein [Halobiforma lacisalsi]APW99454.1 phosphatidylglycerophosphatase [Halobiforma lacisalsi AJ5]EMA31568.1 phosphoesterase PA-phosphatase-like protein [Halobiforma lacisalsi AJ5]
MLLEVLLRLVVVVTVMLIAATAAFVGRYRLRDTRLEWRERVQEAAPITVVLVAVLLGNGVARQTVPDLSWMIGWERTGQIEALEGSFIVWLQSQATPELTAYFSFVYIYAYVFLLVFPIVAYFALSNTRPLRELLAAYTLNYTLGLVCYVFVIAYGPRNMMPELVDALLYDTYPRYQHLTRQVNRNTNVFPSLHTSLATTVAFLAYRTREIYPKWALVALWVALSVAVSTMYLGIHWAIDVLAGVALAYVSVTLSGLLVGQWSVRNWLESRVPPQSEPSGHSGKRPRETRDPERDRAVEPTDSSGEEG